MRERQKATKSSKQGEKTETLEEYSCNFNFESIPDNEPISVPFLALLGSVRNVFRPWLEYHIRRGSKEVLQKLQRYRNPFLDAFFSIASFCGTEDFYVILFPMTYWNYSPKYATLLLTLFGINVFVSNALKNILRLPRPPPPRTDDKVVLDNHGYGWPSMHSMNAVSLPFFFLIHIYQYKWFWEVKDPRTMIFQFAFCCLWLMWIVGSRLYLAVHSPADVIGGLILGAFDLLLFIAFGEPMIDWVLTNPNPISVVGSVSFVCIGLCLVHPFPFNKTVAETIGLLGTVHGFLVGAWLRSTVFTEEITFLTGCSPLYAFALPAIRSLIGMLAIVVTLVVVKKLVSICTEYFFGLQYEMAGFCVAKFISYHIVTQNLTCWMLVVWQTTGNLTWCV